VSQWKSRIVGHGEESPDQLLANPENFRIHPKTQQDALAGILSEVGWVQSVIVNRVTGHLVDGHLRVSLALREDEPTIPVAYVDLTPEEERLILATIDPLTGMAVIDKEKLSELLNEVTITNADLEKALREKIGDLKDGTTLAPDDIPQKKKDAKTKLGDVWALGRHRLMCGDASIPETLRTLLGDEKVSLIVTDPPYFQKVDEEWDHAFSGYEDFLRFIDSVVSLWTGSLLDRGTSAWFCAPDFAWHIEEIIRRYAAPINHIVWFKGHTLGGTVSTEDMRRWRPRSERVLIAEKLHDSRSLLASFNAKTSHIAARSAYKSIIDKMIRYKDTANLSNQEIDNFLGTKGMAGHYFGTSQWTLPTREVWAKLRELFSSRGVEIGEFDAQRAEFDAQRAEFDAQRREFDAPRGENMTDVWTFPTPYGADRFEHVSPKPVEMVAHIIAAHSRPEDIVVDVFSGTGPTLMACESLGRVFRGSELDPLWCDVIVQRWESFTGETAHLVR
jgi:DNA modification methylase